VGRRRLTAAERREEIVAVAIEEFGVTGYHGTSTEVIAEKAGISQPYIFRLYGTKKGLFLACIESCFDRTIEVFGAAAADAENPAQEMGRAYVELLGERSLVLFQHQIYAAVEDPDIRALARRRFVGLATEIERLGGADAVRFIGQGMLLNVVASLGLPPEDWVFLGADT
jgi:AcrR family transcriptional regulator